MLIFDQLRLSDNATKLYINVHVNKADYFKDIYLDNIKIMTADKVSETNPEVPTEDCIFTHTFGDNVKEAALVLTVNDFLTLKQSDMSRTLFFIYVKCKGTVGACVPCRLDELTTLGVTFDEKLLYQRVMNYTKSLADDCKIPVGFTDFILLWNAFKASIETEHYIPAIKFWNQLFDVGTIGNITYKGCGCHG